MFITISIFYESDFFAKELLLCYLLTESSNKDALYLLIFIYPIMKVHMQNFHTSCQNKNYKIVFHYHIYDH